MTIRRIALKSLVALAATSAVAGLYGCVQQQPAAEVATNPKGSSGQNYTPRPSSSSGTGAATPTSYGRNVTVPGGTPVHMTLDSSVGSATSQVGDTISGTTTSAVLVGDQVAIPSGSTIQGLLTSVDPATKGLKIAEKGGTLVLSFTKVTTPSGSSSPMSASLTSAAKSDGKTAGIIGGSAAGGAILGKILGGHTKDAAIGAVVGSGIGTGIAAGTKGKEVVLPAGTHLSIALDQPLTIASRS